MPAHLRAWKETLEDLGMIGLVPEPMPCAPASNTAKAEPMPPRMQNSPRATEPRPKAIAKAPEWEAPTDPLKNPPDQAIEACMTLNALNSCICQCEACPLGAGRIKFVFGEGSPNARMMFVGEGPGSEEDILGRPFVGRAGALLDKMINALNMQRGDVYIANIVKCRPPDNRVPSLLEAQACIRFLKRQIELVNPAVIIGLGATPLRDLVGIPSGITKIRGNWHTVTAGALTIPYMPTFHPAYLLRNYTKEARQAVWSDLQAAHAKSRPGADENQNERADSNPNSVPAG